jgi:hypothetical protein
MLINVTNRPHTTWSPEQMAAAEKFGTIVDFPMPAPDAELGEEEIDRIAGLVVRRVERRLGLEGSAKKECHAVVCQGDFVLVFRIVTMLKAKGITVLAPAFKRVTKPTLRPDGTTAPGYSFDFVRFRSY